MITWTVVCPECGVKERSKEHMTVDQAKAWANAWEKEHWKECSERKTGSEKDS